MLSGLLALLLLARPPAEAITQRERDLFAATASKYLARDSWTESLAYMHGHYLMVPLHSAMLAGDKAWTEEYERHFQRLAASDKKDWCKNPLSRVQYLYLATRYTALCAETGRDSDVARRLEPILTRETIDQWQSDEAIMWDRAPFRGVKARLDYKRSLVRPAKSYYRAVTDEELYLMAMAADLLVYRREKAIGGREDTVLEEMVAYAERIIREDGEKGPDGGWLFQVGVWDDHPDQSFAGHRTISPGMGRQPRNGGTMDSSHFHRFPACLSSLAAASIGGGRATFEAARKGLAHQLVEVVLRPPTDEFPAWRLTNYMDGWNGVYRYSSNAAVGEGKGYGPYELSGTFMLGWWSLLGDKRIQAAYKECASGFPLGEEVLRTFLGPTYAPPPRPSRSWYENGLAELLTGLASKIPTG
jgi:hypothetical protein